MTKLERRMVERLRDRALLKTAHAGFTHTQLEQMLEVPNREGCPDDIPVIREMLKIFLYDTAEMFELLLAEPSARRNQLMAGHTRDQFQKWAPPEPSTSPSKRGPP